MKRFATALIALLALVALAGASGSLSSGFDQPTLGADSTTIPPDPIDVNRSGGAGSPNATQSAEVVDRTTGVPVDSGAGSGGDGGVSSLIVAGLVGALLVAAVLTVVLTDDDTRAPPRDGGTDDGSSSGPPTPPVEPTYDPPADNAVVRAWRGLTERIDGVDDTTTPGETASAALDRGYPTEAVEGITGQFETVRYGRESPTEEQQRRADRLADRIDADGASRSGGDEA
ncbi:DUF4129 domain-containing protein [Halosimplex sp. J119]